jgi:hypothetical protein
MSECNGGSDSESNCGRGFCVPGEENRRTQCLMDQRRLRLRFGRAQQCRIAPTACVGVDSGCVRGRARRGWLGATSRRASRVLGSAPSLGGGVNDLGGNFFEGRFIRWKLMGCAVCRGGGGGRFWRIPGRQNILSKSFD